MVDLLAAADKYTTLYVWLAVLWLLIIVLGAGIWYYRRRWWLSESGADTQPWTLADLRQLRDTGGMTEEEYQQIRSAMIAGMRGDSSVAGSPAEPPDASHKT